MCFVGEFCAFCWFLRAFRLPIEYTDKVLAVAHGGMAIVYINLQAGRCGVAEVLRTLGALPGTNHNLSARLQLALHELVQRRPLIADFVIFAVLRDGACRCVHGPPATQAAIRVGAVPCAVKGSGCINRKYLALAQLAVSGFTERISEQLLLHKARSSDRAKNRLPLLR